MRTDPESHDSVHHLTAQGSVVNTDADRPQLADLLEVEGGMLRILLQKTIVLVRICSDVLRKGSVLRPESRGSVVLQSSRVLPVS